MDIFSTYTSTIWQSNPNITGNFYCYRRWEFSMGMKAATLVSECAPHPVPEELLQVPEFHVAPYNRSQLPRSHAE